MSGEDADYVCTLDEASLKVARDELKEDPKERLGHVQTFRKWINDQKHLKCPTDTTYLLKFLRTAKFSQLRAREVLEGHLSSKGECPLWLNDFDSRDPGILKLVKLRYLTPLPKKDVKGRQLILLRPGVFDPNPKLYDKDAFLKMIFGLMTYLMLDENVVVNGFIFIMDFTLFTPKFFSFFGMEAIQKSTKMWQGRFPGRFKAFHYFNPGSLLEGILAIIKPMLSKKFQDRIQIHGKNLEDFYKVIPMEYLPEEYLPDEYTGPSQGKIDDIIDDMVREMQTDRVRDALLHMTSSKWGCDRAQKDSGIPNASFRKLNVD